MKTTPTAALDDPARRLLEIEAIKQLKARYFRLMDTKDWKGFAAVFALRLLHETGYWTSSAFGDSGLVERPAKPASHAARLLGLGALGGFLPLAIFIAYSISIFGTPTIPYEYTYLEGFRGPFVSCADLPPGGRVHTETPSHIGMAVAAGRHRADRDVVARLQMSLLALLTHD